MNFMKCMAETGKNHILDKNARPINGSFTWDFTHILRFVELMTVVFICYEVHFIAIYYSLMSFVKNLLPHECKILKATCFSG